MTTSNEVQARKLSDVWFEMYQTCVLHRPEVAAEMERLITGTDIVPDTATVRSFIAAIVRGALVTRPEAARSHLKLPRNPLHWLFR